MLRFFVRNGFENVPRLAGWWAYTGTLAQRLPRDREPVRAGYRRRLVAGAVGARAGAAEQFAARMDRLGTVVGEMHSVLASDPSDPVFAPEEASAESLALLTATVDDEIAAVFAGLPEDEVVAADRRHTATTCATSCAGSPPSALSASASATTAISTSARRCGTATTG